MSLPTPAFRMRLTAGTTTYNGFTITHGCGGHDETKPPLKVLGQSAVFPFGVAVWTNLNPPVKSYRRVARVSSARTDDFITLNVGGIQDNDPFAKTEEETDDLENVRALNWKNGKLATNLVGIPEWRASAPTILDNCVSALHVRIAVANWCKKNANEKNDHANNRADWWFTGPDQTGSTQFVDPDLVQEDFWTTLTVNNPGNPDAPACTGETREVAVQPTGADIDTYLPYKPFTKNPGPY